jgi:hypothetical protein
MTSEKVDNLVKRVLFNTKRLRELSIVFERIGNEKVTDELVSAAYDLEKGLEAFTGGVIEVTPYEIKGEVKYVKDSD